MVSYEEGREEMNDIRFWIAVGILVVEGALLFGTSIYCQFKYG